MVYIEPPLLLSTLRDTRSGDILARLQYFPNGARFSTHYHVVKMVKKSRCAYVVCVSPQKKWLFFFHDEDLVEYKDDYTKINICYAWERSKLERRYDWCSFVRYAALEGRNQRREEKRQKKHKKDLQKGMKK